jgi:UDP:flavonoid glycosyltransferase YjiC (YdhE family)
VSSFLFVTWEGGGNAVPFLALGQELVTRGHTVTVMGHASQSAAFAAAGVPFLGAPGAAALAGTSPLALLKVITSPGMQRDVLAEVAARPADVVVVDVVLFGVMDALRRAGREYVVLEHTLDGMLRRMLPVAQAALLPMGLCPMDLLDAGRPVMTASIPEFDRGHGNVVHVGPMVRGVPAHPERPTVLISLSTAGFPGLAATFQRVLDGVDGVAARLIATTGPSLDPAALRIPDGVEVHRWLPHEEVLPHVSLVVSHGGHGTAMAALAHGVPLLVLPLNPTTDQPWVGRAVERAGVGRRLRRTSPRRRIRAAVEQLLGEGPHRAAAAHMGELARALDGRTRGADLLESVAARRL